MNVTLNRKKKRVILKTIFINQIKNLLKTKFKIPTKHKKMAKANFCFFAIREIPKDKIIRPEKTVKRYVLNPTKRQKTPQIIHFSAVVKPFLVGAFLLAIIAIPLKKRQAIDTCQF